MPRRYFSYPERYQWLNVASTLGAGVLALGLVTVLAYLLVSLLRGRAASDNPWDSRSFEWRTSTPPPKHNFAFPPRFDPGPYAYDIELQRSSRGGADG